MSEAAEALRQAQAAGWRVFEVALPERADKSALLAALARAIQAPPEFGANWDALADALQDLSWLPEVTGYALVLRGEVSGLNREERSIWHRILADSAAFWRAQGVPFQVIELPYKQPVSALVVIYTAALDVLLLERADHPGYWQSVTGSRDGGEALWQTAAREVAEETGLDAAQFVLSDWQQQNRYDIYPLWQHRYPPGTAYNTEHVFGLALPEKRAVRLAPREHLSYQWLPWDAAAAQVFSPSNRAAILELPERVIHV